MIFIIGGVYQGKFSYAKERFCFQDEDVCDCKTDAIDLTKKCVWHIEELCFSLVKEGIEPKDYFMERREQWKDSVLICGDIFCGVVPIDDTLREWRQATARLCQYLSREAEEVIRIFCGLEQKLK